MIDADTAQHWAAAAVVAIGGAALGVRKIYSAWVKEAPDIAGNHARADVIDYLREEVTRLASVNTELAKQVNSFQLENIQLTARLSTVTTQMTELQLENAKLGLEVVELRDAIHEFKAMFKKCNTCPDYRAHVHFEDQQ